MAVVGMNGRTKESGGGECGRAKQAMENVNEELGKAVIRVVECEDAGEGRDLRVASVVTYSHLQALAPTKCPMAYTLQHHLDLQILAA